MRRPLPPVVPPFLVAVVALTATRAAEPADLAALFPREAEIFIATDGVQRLVLPAEVLEACRGDLSDLRVFDRQGREVPYVVDSGPPVGQVIEETRTVAAPILDVARRTEPRGKGAPPFGEQRLDLATPPEGSWDLVLSTGARRFVRHVEVLGIEEDGSEVSLISGESLFRLPGSGGAEKLRLTVPSFDGRRLRVVLTGEDGMFLEPTLRWESTQRRERGSWVQVPLAEIGRERRDGSTWIELARPAGVVPDLLRATTASRLFDRPAIVRDLGPGIADPILGQANLLRVGSLAPVESLEVRLRPARGDRLLVEVRDGDSPPLEELAFTAVVRQPTLLFDLGPGSSDVAAGILRFGGGRAHPPRYDLPGLLPPGRGREDDPRINAMARLQDPAQTGSASLGPARENPRFDPSPALAFALRPGATIDGRLFEYRRPFVVQDAPEGLVRLPLQPEDVAAMRPDLADVRVVDGEDRQWPYLLDREGDRVELSVEASRSEAPEGGSRYDLALPAAPIPIDRVRVDPDVPFLDRDYRLVAREEEGEERVLASGRLVRRAGDAGSVEIGFPATRVASLALLVQDGDDAPLPIAAARVRWVQPVLYVAVPEAEYALLLGQPEEVAPRYELDRARDVVLGVRSSPAAAGPLGENPGFRLAARLGRGKTGQRALLWSVLIGAVIALGVLTLRLVRAEPPKE